MNCPKCDKPDFDDKHCGFCGCRMEINEESGNKIYMVRGRIVAAPEDVRQQKIKRGLLPDPDPMDLREDQAASRALKEKTDANS